MSSKYVPTLNTPSFEFLCMVVIALFRAFCTISTESHIEMVLRVSSSEVRGQVYTKSVNRKTEMKNSLLAVESKDLKHCRSAVVCVCSAVATPIGFVVCALFRASSTAC